MKLLAFVAKLIGWLGGSLAAISAIFYAFGYLITLANLQMLGLDTIILGFDPDFYVQRGGRFVLYTVRLVGGFALQPATGAVLLLAAGLIVMRLWGGAEKVLVSAGKGYRKLTSFAARNASVAYMILLLILLQHLLPTYQNVTSPLRISGLLFEAAGENSGSYSEEAVGLRDALLKNAEQTLRLKFLFTTLLAVETALFLFFSWRVTRELPARLLLVAPFTVVFVMSVIALPMVYGLIALPNRYPTVHLSVVEASEGRPPTYFLMNSSRDFLVLWDSRNRRVVWHARGEVDRVTIGRECELPLAGQRAAGEDVNVPGACP